MLNMSALCKIFKRPGIVTGLCMVFLLPFVVPAQEITQTIRGVVLDKDSQVTLPGAHLIIAGSDPPIGTVTDVNGEFSFGKLPVGRYNITVYYLGYETQTIPNVLLNSGKETVLKIELTESVVKLSEVVISGKQNKAEAINKMATVSVMKLNVEEMEHYAGTLNDAARTVSSFAGVASNPSGTNDIIIRGNSPRGMAWRLEGIDIPNPNHFAEEGSSSGGLSILNGAVLANSDFFTGAFPAEYGNAYSGVFDMSLRDGNNKTHEYSIQAGFLGLDATFEGPFRKGNPSSYLFNYRFSTLTLFQALGIKLVGDAVPSFQDLTFKIKVPTEHSGTFSIFGIGGMSKVTEEETHFKNDYTTGMWVIGAKNIYFINKTTYLTSIIAYTGSVNKWDYKTLDKDNDFTSKAIDNFIYQTPRISLNVNHKFNSKNVLKTGVDFTFSRYDLLSDRYDYEINKLVTGVYQNGSTILMQAWVSWKHRFNEKLTLVSGLHSMYLLLNGNYTIEPRLGMKWSFRPSQALNFGFGLHSRMESLSTYFARQTMADGVMVMPNKDLDFTKAVHFVLGYENLLKENLFFKAELYYQYLYDVPVENNDTSSFSILNYSFGYPDRALVNQGTGRNVGVELTLEKYFSRNYYFLITTSLFNSRYKALDGIERNTRYNSNYILNVLGGKNFIIGNSQRKRTLSLNLRGTWAGGQWSTPIDLERSREEGTTVRNEKLAFSERWKDFIRIDFKISISRNRKRATHMLELDIQNITNQLNVTNNYYDPYSGKIKTTTQMGIVPVLNYRVQF